MADRLHVQERTAADGHLPAGLDGAAGLDQGQVELGQLVLPHGPAPPEVQGDCWLSLAAFSSVTSTVWSFAAAGLADFPAADVARP